MKIMNYLVLCGVAIGLLTGCVTPPGPYVAKADPKNPETAGVGVVILDPDLRRTVAVDEPALVRRNENGLLHVQVAIRNISPRENLQLQAQTIFRDDSGLVLNSQPGAEAPWDVVTLTPGEIAYYSRQAMSPEATRFTVRIRYLAGTR